MNLKNREIIIIENRRDLNEPFLVCIARRGDALFEASDASVERHAFTRVRLCDMQGGEFGVSILLLQDGGHHAGMRLRTILATHHRRQTATDEPYKLHSLGSCYWMPYESE